VLHPYEILFIWRVILKKLFISILSLAGMFLVIGVAYWLDNRMDALRVIAMAEFKMGTWLLPATAAHLVVAGLLLGWLWFIYSKDNDQRVIAILYILVGLGLLFYNYCAIAFSQQLTFLNAIMPKSMTSSVCAVVAIVGLHRLIFRKTSP